ncbi:NB-ARC domain-containing disease resistance protein [Prunus dulcis]|uniref:NB-ARC domain-containing disease resistance protein n=1 Tax=Prunus dulcis TaxID=3755 RepID=A0A4Y1RS48_PRUDU|nr:NB-ARC domain-containing disease resistance protein [Prunus dulcis]
MKSTNSRKLGGHRTRVSFSRGASQDDDIANCSKAGVARSMERQVVISSNRRSCPSVPDVVGILLDPASGRPVSIYSNPSSKYRSSFSPSGKDRDSAAKGVRRHGVDPNRSRNEEDMLLLSPPAATLPRPSSLPDVAPAASLGADLRDRCQTNQHTTADISRPTSAAAVVRIGRNLPWKPTVRPNATRTSSSNISLISSPNLSSEAPGARQNYKRDLRRIEVVEVHRIHHRATLNLHASKSDGSAPTHADFDPEPDPDPDSEDDPDPDPDSEDNPDPDPDSEDDPDPDHDLDPDFEDDPDPEFVSDSDPNPDFHSDSGLDSGSDSDPNSYSTCILCIFRCTDYDFSTNDPDTWTRLRIL